MKEYALYKGEELLSIGTIKEIATELNILQQTVRYYGTGAYKRKIANRKNTKNTRVLIILEEDEIN